MDTEPFLCVSCSANLAPSAFVEILRARGSIAVLSETDISTCLSSLPANRDVVIVSDQTWILKSHSDRPGLLAVLIHDGDCTLSPQGPWICVSDLESLTPLFDASLSDVLSLLRLDVFEARKRLDSISADFLDAVHSAGGLHIFGAGTIGYQVLQACRKSNIQVLGFVDNNLQRQNGLEKGVPIRAPAAIDRESDVVVVAVGNHAMAISEQLRVLGFRYVVNLSKFFYATASDSQPETGYLNDLYENRLQWIALALRLEDVRSRLVINALVQHRLTLDTDYLATIKDVNMPQWFDPAFIKPNRQAVFVDGGAFDGDTAEAFRRFNGPAKRIHAFELDTQIAARALLRLASFPEILVHPKGLSNGPARIGFIGSGSTDGRIDASAISKRYVEVVSIDDTVTEGVTYLKLDVEGAESLALSGAKGQIRVNSPVIGLAVYHKPSDPWLLTTQLMCLNKRYRYYMRHYTDVAFETVIYAIPDNI